MIRGARLFSTLNWYPWSKEAFSRARKYNLPTLVLCGTANPVADQYLNRTLFSDPDVSHTLKDSFVPIKLTHANRDIRKAMTMYIESKLGNSINLFHSVIVNPHTLYPYNCSADVNPSTYKQFLLENSKLKKGSLPNIHSAGDPKMEIDISDSLDQAYLQYKDLSYNQNSIFRFVMGYALCQLHKKHSEFVTEELNAIAKGGVVDHIGGGVFTGAYFKDWHLPGLSKQLASQSMLLATCATSLQVQPSLSILKLAESLVAGVEQLVNRNSSMVHGTSASYFWEYKEFMTALSSHVPDLISKDILQMYWGVNENGNINPELLESDLKISPLMNVLTPYKSIEEVAATFGVSSDHVQKLVDRSYTALGEYRAIHMPLEESVQGIQLSHRGLALSALSRASAVLPKTSAATAISVAHELAERIVESKDDLIVCDDYTYTITGLLDYYCHVSKDSAHLAVSRALQDKQISIYRDHKQGGFFYSQNIPDLFSRPKFTNDSLEPNYNGVSASNLLRLSSSPEDKYVQVAKEAISQGAQGTATHPLSHLSFVEAQLRFAEVK